MARRKEPTVHGVAVVDKPAGVTSHDVVAMLRRRLNERRIGHAGTLDPSATGVLVIGVGHATRLLRFITDGHKRYVGEVVLGVETDSLDADGTVTATHEMAPVDLDTVRALIADRFVGDIEQVPPMVSAIKIGGRRLHELARAGVEVERQPRPVTISSFDVIDSRVEDGRQILTVDVACSAGTYVRSLAADLGTALGGGAHLRNLRRTAVEPFTLDDAAPPDECELLPIVDAVRGMPQFTVDGPLAARVAVGSVLPAPPGDGPWAMVTPDRQLLAVYEAHGDGFAKPSVVLPQPS
ncbi:tRNA pseudouridine(55) synthase TruB [Desertimonas flava]|jgi:tRNA pseudouridine55 synthase|uniref:tRNA pseudouridine(55) synthase TruB n=1 Tax=Desertimonas flava TaxID=2064846 RepID=UPI000E34D01E|nr:tRNA pseudouridine(55) synthase TruB [Desertimonas flava]